MTDLFAPLPPKHPGEANGRALGYIVNGASRQEMQDRWKSGELRLANPGYIKAWLEEYGRQ